MITLHPWLGIVSGGSTSQCLALCYQATGSMSVMMKPLCGRAGMIRKLILRSCSGTVYVIPVARKAAACLSRAMVIHSPAQRCVPQWSPAPCGMKLNALPFQSRKRSG